MKPDKMLDMLFTGGKGSDNDSRFGFQVGDSVRISEFRDEQVERWGIDHSGKTCEILGRRNGYPPPHFNCWFPLYWLENVGELHESMLERTDTKSI